MTNPLPSRPARTAWRLFAAATLVLSFLEFGVGGPALGADPRGTCDDELRQVEELLRTGQADEAIRRLRDDPSSCSGPAEAGRQLLLGLAYLIAAGPEQRPDELEAAATVLLGLIESDSSGVHFTIKDILNQHFLAIF